MPQQTNIDQAHHMQEQQIINEEISSLEVPEKQRGKAKKAYEECDLVSRESLECVSHATPEDEVMLIISYKLKYFRNIFLFIPSPMCKIRMPSE